MTTLRHPRAYLSSRLVPALSSEPTWTMVAHFILRVLRAPCQDNRTAYINPSLLAPLLCYRLDRVDSKKREIHNSRLELPI